MTIVENNTNTTVEGTVPPTTGREGGGVSNITAITYDGGVESAIVTSTEEGAVECSGAEVRPPGGAGGGDDDSGSIAASAGKNDPLRRKASLSETAQLSAGGWDAPFPFNLLFEVPFRIKDPTTKNYVQEATGWAMDSAARGPLNQIGSYVGGAVLQLASIDAGCESSRGCNETVAAGLKASSLLTLVSTIIGVIAALLMPVAGAIVDHTHWRKLVGIVSGFICVLVTGMQIGINYDPNNWLYILILDAIQSFALLVHSTAVFAYLPDITLDHDALPKYTAHFNIRQYCSQITVGAIVILSGQLYLRTDPTPIQASVRTARDGAAIAFTYGCVFFGYSWTFLFRKRPALSQVPEDSNLLTTGFKQVYKTTRKIGKDYRALRWFMISLLWSPEAGNGVVLSIAVTYFIFMMKFTTLDIAQVALVVMVLNIVGSFFSRWLCTRTRVNPLNSYRIAMTLFAASFVAGAIYMDRPERKYSAYGFCASLGFFMGWAYPSQRILLVTLIPKGQETEMMGLFFFMGQILGWLPPLIFTIMNENGVDMRYGLGMISFFAFFAVICTLPMGSYEAAVELVARDSEAKLNSVLEAASHHENYDGGHSPTGNQRASSKKSNGNVPPIAEDMEHGGEAGRVWYAQETLVP